MISICKMRFVAASVVLGMALLAGCGPSAGPTGTVSGTVTLDGQSVESGEISFVSSDGFAASATISNGQFKLEDALPVGTYSIGISPPALTEAPGEGGDQVAAPISSIPTGYHMPGTSGLKQEIKEGDNTVTVELSKSGPPA